MFPELALATAITTAAPVPVAQLRVHRVCLNLTGVSETPLPTSLPDELSFLWDALGTVGTGSDRSVTRTLPHLLAWKQVATMLPTTDAADAFVDNLMAASRPRGTVKRVLAPRRR